MPTWPRSVRSGSDCHVLLECEVEGERFDDEQIVSILRDWAVLTA